MIFLILKFLQDTLGVHVPVIFFNTSTRAILACITAIVMTFLFGAKFIKKLYELKIGQPIREEAGFLLGQLHKNKKNTPTMGGILLIFAVSVSLLLWMDLSSAVTWILFFTSVILGLLGGYDDYLKLRYKSAKGLSAKKKLFVQLSWALLIIAYLQIPQLSQVIESYIGIKAPFAKEFSEGKVELLSLHDYTSRLYMPFLKEPFVIFSGIGLLLLWAFLSFVIVGASNAVNLTDGLDGLATGLMIFVAASLGIVAFLSNNVDTAAYFNILYIEGSGEVSIFLAALVGACLGFLWYNCSPAQVFMGDIGSLSLGGMIGVSSILLGREFFLGLAGILFVAEALSVIIQVVSYRYRNKKRVFLCAPLHHHFEYLGWAETKVVCRFWIIGFLFSIIALSSIKFQ